MLDFSSLLKAQQELKEDLYYAEKKDLDVPKKLRQVAAIQCFEFSYELAWKTMKRLLFGRGKVLNSPREVFRESALEGFIKDPLVWFEFLRCRNLTTHTYNQEVADEIYKKLDMFSKELAVFIDALPQS